MGAYFSWSTNKSADGTFSFAVTRNTPQHEALPSGSYCAPETVKTETGFRTRAQAKGRAVQWLRYFRQRGALAEWSAPVGWRW